MIDRLARDKFAELLRHLVAGQISNDEFEDNLPLGSSDRAVSAIFWNGAWMLYDDMREYKLTGKYRLPRDAKREVARWILFLKTDFEYEWPRIQGIFRFPWYLIVIFTLGLVIPIARYKLHQAGDISVWPFLRITDLEQEKSTPPYLRAVA
ncbi:hypothetical protein [Uliginosibacterium sp. TH139]|uniref:hypothetical protein n=1 Tax=Uliginosibacterium sp. TH139 TaxID=2067453 RepID=UPI001180F4BC|nr:hypothetical protein [Uliginosibacterium sp. TH139]